MLIPDRLLDAVPAVLLFDPARKNVFVTGEGPIGIMGAAIASRGITRHVVHADIDAGGPSLAAEVGDVVPVDGPREDPDAVDAVGGIHSLPAAHFQHGFAASALGGLHKVVLDWAAR